MDERSQKMFDSLVKREVESFSDGDIAFLRARKLYLTIEQAEKFMSILEPKPAKVEAPVKAKKAK